MGIKAICTGIRFCDREAIAAIVKIKVFLLSLIKEPIPLTRISVTPVWLIAMARAPRSI